MYMVGWQCLVCCKTLTQICHLLISRVCLNADKEQQSFVENSDGLLIATNYFKSIVTFNHCLSSLDTPMLCGIISKDFLSLQVILNAMCKVKPSATTPPRHISLHCLYLEIDSAYFILIHCFLQGSHS